MPTPMPTIVVVTTHSAFVGLYERHCKRFAKVVVVPNIAEFLRRALTVHAQVLVIDLHAEGITPSLVKHVHDLHTQPVTKALSIVALCAHTTPHDIAALHAAGINDIILTAHHAPRAIAERIHLLLSI